MVHLGMRLPENLVLIESDWNLKYFRNEIADHEGRVLIESDWNLKRTTTCDYCGSELVLIESDWNLKPISSGVMPLITSCINRIRLEFKDVSAYSKSYIHGSSINRIRLEFKGVLCLNTLSHTHKY